MKIRLLKHVFMIVIASLVLAGCGLFSGGKEDIDPPGNVSYEDDLDLGESDETSGDEESDESDENNPTVETQLFLIDEDGYVVPRTFDLPYKESVATQALEYLVANGPINEQLPNGFRAVLPADTSLTVKIDEGLATVDFSKEFTEYAPEDELKILQAVTWTLTQFDTVDRVKLQVNGNELTDMPVNTNELTRNIGINVDVSNTVDITNTRPVTVYYISNTDEEAYFVPVTVRVSNKEDNKLTAVVEKLIKGPDFQSNLFTALMSDVKLLEDPTVKDGVVTLNFNENILGSYEQNLVSNEVLNTLVLSLTEQEGIEGVSIQVNGEADIVNEEGNTLTEPVYRPKNVNTGSF